MPSGLLRVAVRNVAGASYPGNRYRTAAVQEAGFESVLSTGADVLVLQEATGVGRPFGVPTGWRALPASPLDRGCGSVIVAADHVDIDLAWRPRHPVLDAFGAYLDFGLLHLEGTDIAVVSVHATRWQDAQWAATGAAGPTPTSSDRPWSSDVLLDTLLAVLGDQQAILAGDWNEAPNFPTEGDPGTAAWFGRARAAGLVEAVGTTFGGPIRTNFCASTKASYQNDHVFLTSGVAGRLRSVCVWNEPDARVSDHAGIIITLA